jgi:hypothetical protein
VGHGLHPIPIVATRTGVGLVGTEGNDLSSTWLGLLSSYLDKISI